jgi:cytochrome c oxidase subunit III
MSALHKTYNDIHGTLPPRGHGDGDDHNSGPSDDPPGYYERRRRYRMAVAIGLVSVVMIFVSLTSAYIVRQGLGVWDEEAKTYVTDWQPAPLPNLLLIINTLVLLASSATLEMARRSLDRHAITAGLSRVRVAEDPERSLPWLGITLILGCAFVIGQYNAWQEMRHAGWFISVNPSSSFFYVLTGTHAVHLAGGLIALFYAALTPLLRKPLDTRRLVVDVTGWYWHFMAGLWIYIFALLHFMK